jgi:hypothetical protein
MDEVRFHMTLTERLAPADLDWVERLARATFAAHLHRPVTIDALTLCAEGADGMFHPVHRAALVG